MMIILYGFLAIAWLVMLLTVFSKKVEQNKFTIGCAYLLVALFFLEKMIVLIQ